MQNAERHRSAQDCVAVLFQPSGKGIDCFTASDGNGKVRQSFQVASVCRRIHIGLVHQLYTCPSFSEMQKIGSDIS